MNMVARTVDAFGRLDILVNNAALFTSIARSPFDEISVDVWDKVMAVNIKGVWLGCKAAVPEMRKNKYGKIISICTGRIFKGAPFFLHYDASKGAVSAMTRSLIRELGPKNVRVNTIMPGLTLSEGVLAREGILDRAKPISRARSLARDQQPQDLVGATAFFLSDMSGFVTGQSLIVDGGGLVQ